MHQTPPITRRRLLGGATPLGGLAGDTAKRKCQNKRPGAGAPEKYRCINDGRLRRPRQESKGER